MVVPHKAPVGSLLTGTKRLVINYQKLNKQLTKVQTVQAKVKGTVMLTETAKIEHIWAKLKGAQYFSSLDMRGGYHRISIPPRFEV